MNVFLATWSTIAGLSLMLVGGLVVWAYGGSRSVQPIGLAANGLEAEATQMFHEQLARWFFVYGSLVITFGLVMLLWAASHLMAA